MEIEKNLSILKLFKMQSNIWIWSINLNKAGVFEDKFADPSPLKQP